MLEWPTRQCDADTLRFGATMQAPWEHSCTGGRTDDEGGVTWQKREGGRTARLKWLLDNKTHPFHWMVGAIGNPTDWGHLCHLKYENQKDLCF